MRLLAAAVIGAAALCGSSAVAGDGAVMHLKPGQASVVVSPVLKVLSTVHYQATVGVTCSGTTCFGNFPAPGTKKRLNITRIYCYLQSNNAGSHFGYARAELHDFQNTLLISEFLSDIYTSTAGTHTLNNAIDLDVTGGQHLAVNLNLASDTGLFGYCTASGTLSTLG
jgi:hypothetical protein